MPAPTIRHLTKSVLCALAFALVFCAPVRLCRAGEFANPLMVGADPHALTDGKTVWMYPTGGGAFYAYSSDDPNLKKWKRHGPVLKLSDVRWAGKGGRPWAPGVIERDGKWYFYYSIGPKPSSIGVAVGDSPAGPFRDSGRPLLQDKGKRGFEAIDPMVFADPKSGKYYLYAGGSAGSTLRVFEMNPDMVSFAKEIPAKTPVGPWAYRGVILASDAKHKGPGHHSFFINPADGALLIAYHRYDGVTGSGPYKTPRKLAIERVYYNPDGTIRPIVMTDGGNEGK